MAKKKNNKLVIGLVAVLFLFALQSDGGLFSIARDTDLFLFDQYIMSPSILKAGITSPLDAESCLFDIFDTCTVEQDVLWMNDLISKFYATAIFDYPLQLSNDVSNNLLVDLQGLNAGVEFPNNAEDAAIAKHVTPPLISEEAFAIVSKNAYSMNDLKTLSQEINAVSTNLCNALLLAVDEEPEIFVETPCLLDIGDRCFENPSTGAIVRFCEDKPEEILRVRSNGITADLPDYRIMDNGIPRTYDLSSITFSIFEKPGGDLVAGVGGLGVSEASAIKGRENFSQYAFEIEHGEAITSFDNVQISQEFGYFAVSNDLGVVDASNGLIADVGDVIHPIIGIIDDNKPKSDSDKKWYENPIVWIVGAAILILAR